jgi:hypothetical protein
MYMKRKLPIILLTSLIMLSFWQFTTNVSAQQKLTLAMILTGLQTKGKTPETSTLDKRNAYITRKVLTSGVTFRLTPDIEREIRNAGASNALITAIRDNGPYVAPTVTPRTNTKPSALFKDLWIDYDAKEGTEKGLRIHVKFTVYGMKNLPSYVAIYFKDEDGNFLKDSNGKFASSSGEVAVYRELDVGYDPGDYNDLSVFMPFDELDLDDGNHDLKMDVKLIYKAGGLIQQLTTKDFNYKQGDAVTKNTGAISAKVTRVWADYNVTEEGKKGMRLHVNFEVTGLKGIDSMVSARVQKSNGDFLKNDSADYSNDEGLLQIKFAMKPGFDTAVFKDADLFLPYNEINVSKGKSNLKFDIDINYENGELIQHLDFYEFQFDRP